MLFKSIRAIHYFIISTLMTTNLYAGGCGMPWESTMTSITTSLQGPWVDFAVVVCIIMSGSALAFGEVGGMFKKGIQAILGLSLAAGSGSLGMMLFPSDGVLF